MNIEKLREAFEAIWPAAKCLLFKDGKYEPKYESHWMRQGAEQLNPLWVGFQKGVAYQRTQAPAQPAQVQGWQMVQAVDAAMIEMENISPPMRRSECERLIRAALAAAPQPSDDVAKALKTAANRMQRLALEVDGDWRGYATEWAEEALAAIDAAMAGGE